MSGVNHSLATASDLENQASGQKVLIDLRDRLIKLEQNPDFRKVISEGFLVNECARYAKLSVDTMLDPINRADALGFAQAAGYLQRFFMSTKQLGNQAEQSLRAVEDEAVRARNEESGQFDEGQD